MSVYHSISVPDRPLVSGCAVEPSNALRVMAALRTVATLLQKRRRRKATVRLLEALDDRMLTDIGISRAQIAVAARTNVRQHGFWS